MEVASPATMCTAQRCLVTIDRRQHRLWLQHRERIGGHSLRLMPVHLAQSTSLEVTVGLDRTCTAIEVPTSPRPRSRERSFHKPALGQSWKRRRYLEGAATILFGSKIDTITGTRAGREERRAIPRWTLLMVMNVQLQQPLLESAAPRSEVV